MFKLPQNKNRISHNFSVTTVTIDDKFNLINCYYFYKSIEKKINSHNFRVFCWMWLKCCCLSQPVAHLVLKKNHTNQVLSIVPLVPKSAIGLNHLKFVKEICEHFAAHLRPSDKNIIFSNMQTTLHCLSQDHQASQTSPQLLKHQVPSIYGVITEHC